MRRLALACLGAGLLTAAPAEAAGKLPDGLYGCYISSMMLGQIEIDGDVYRGPAYDQKWEGDYPFEVTDQGTVNWGGPLGGISLAGTVVATVLVDAGGGRVGFDITLQNTSGNFQTISCLPE